MFIRWLGTPAAAAGSQLCGQRLETTCPLAPAWSQPCRLRQRPASQQYVVCSSPPTNLHPTLHAPPSPNPNTPTTHTNARTHHPPLLASRNHCREFGVLKSASPEASTRTPTPGGTWPGG